MAQPNDTMGMLDLMVRPGFCVRDHRIVRVNRAAEALLIAPGGDIESLLLTGKEEYKAFRDGCLYLTLSLSGHSWGASVTRMADGDIFLLEQEDDQAELQAMALAARELRGPLASVMTTAEQLFPLAPLDEDPQLRDQVARLNRGLYQMLRVVCNMSDAGRYTAGTTARMEMMDISAFFAEIFEKHQPMVAETGVSLRFSNLRQSVFTLADGEKLERAVLNMLSNALKFTPRGSTIDASLTRSGRLLRLTLQDSGEGVDEKVRGSIFSRYLRQPSIEDSRFGLGLGMVLIRSAAAMHGGTVLLDSTEGKGARITMTMQIRQSPESTLHSPLFRVDYTGERDHGLIELSECLPASAYESRKLH